MKTQCDRILNGIRVALKASCGEGEGFEDWLGGLARRDCRGCSESLFVLPAEIVSNVVVGLEGALLDLTSEEQSDVLTANQFFHAITFMREIAFDWGCGLSAAPTSAEAEGR